MYKFIFPIVFVLLSGLPALAQTNDTGTVYNVTEVDSPAVFPGGITALSRFLADNIKYPQKALDDGVQGRIVLRFRIDEDGYIGKIVVEKGLSRECDDEAIRVVLRFPRFTPAKLNGRAVACWFTQPINFRLE